MYEKGLKFLNQIKEFLDDRDITIIQDMNDFELEKFLQILEEYAEYGSSHEFDKIESADYIRTPVSIETFLDDPNYIGEVGKNVYPKLREDLITIFNNPNLVEIILSGSIGWGKSHMSKIIAMYVLYTISCLRNPQEFFGITPGTPIVLCNLSLSVSKSDEFFTDIRNMLDASPYFKKYFPRLPRIKSSLVFPNQVTFISAGSQESGVIGSNVIFCFTGDTKVSLLDGTERTFKELAEDYHDKEFWVYSSKEDGEIVPGLAHSPQITRYVTELVEVTLDNGEKVKCTPDHLWMLRDGTYKSAKNLTKNDSLMPLYRKVDKFGYEEVKDNKTNSFINTHKKSAELCYRGPRHTVRHHINFNKRDNRPDNLKWASFKGHWGYHGLLGSKVFKEKYQDMEWAKWKSRHHSDLMKKRWKDPNTREVHLIPIQKASIELWKTEEHRDKMRPIQSKNLKNSWNKKRDIFLNNVSKNGKKNLKKLWKDPKFAKNRKKNASKLGNTIGKKKLQEWNLSDEGKKFHSNLMKKNNLDKSYSNNRIDKLKSTFLDSNFKDKNSKRISEMHKNKEYSTKLKEGARAFLTSKRNSPEFKRNNARGKVLKVINKLKFLNLEINEETYNKHKPNTGVSRWENLVPKYFDSYDELIYFNHKVVSVEVINLKEPIPVYDLTVEKYHNFALSSGVFVHNCIMDEVNFMQRSKTSKKKTSEKEEYNQALELYNAILSRLYSRFMYYGKTMGKVVIISSKRYPNDFLEEHIKKSKGNKNVFILDYATWDVKDKSQFSGKWFNIYIGDGLEKPRILENGEDLSKFNEKTVIKVPEEYRGRFEMDLLRSIRDIAGISILGTNLFIYNSNKVKDAFDEEREIPATSLKTNFSDGFQLKKEVLFKLDNNGNPVAFKKFPNMPRFIHVDLSKNDCDTGLSMGCFGGYKAVTKVGLNGVEYVEQLPITWIDLAISIGVDPELSEINQNKIKDFIKSIRDLGVNIKKVSTDTYQNLGLKQGLLELGIEAVELSTVTSLEPYIELKNSIITDRFNCHPQPVARKEVTTLEKDKAKNVVDHPPNGSKDIADCLAAICYWVSKEHVFMEDVIPERMGTSSNFYGENTSEKLNNADFLTADLDLLSDEDRFMRQMME